MAGYDELWSGMAVVAAPGVEQAHRVDHVQYTLFVFTVPLLAASLIEAPLMLLSDRAPRRGLVASGLVVLAVALTACALARSALWLSIGLALAGAASGVACAAAQAELVSLQPGRADRAMSRWAAWSAVGDVLCPLVLGAIFALGGSHRAGLMVAACGIALQALWIWRSAPQDVGDALASADVVPEPPLVDALRLTLRRPRLWAWLLAAGFCFLLDEVVVALAALRLHDELACSHALSALATVGFSCGVLLGAVTTEWLLARLTARSLLVGSALASGSALFLVVEAQSAFGVVAALFLLGVCAAPHHPLATAAAYDLVPHKPGLVNALAQVFVVLEVTVPWLLGELATRYGVRAALAALAIQPLIVLVVAIGSAAHDRTPTLSGPRTRS